MNIEVVEVFKIVFGVMITLFACGWIVFGIRWIIKESGNFSKSQNDF